MIVPPVVTLRCINYWSVNTLHSATGQPQESGERTWSLCPSSALTSCLIPFLLSAILHSPLNLHVTPLICSPRSALPHSFILLCLLPLPSLFLCIALSFVHMFGSFSTVSHIRASPVMQLKPRDWLGLARCKVGKWLLRRTVGRAAAQCRWLMMQQDLKQRPSAGVTALCDLSNSVQMWLGWSHLGDFTGRFQLLFKRKTGEKEIQKMVFSFLYVLWNIAWLT